MERKVRKTIFISGKVHNVFFRRKMEEMAKNLGVCGTVMNLRDGQVKAVLEGKEKAVDKIIKWARKGPSEAKVEKLIVFSQPYLAKYKLFKIVVL